MPKKSTRLGDYGDQPDVHAFVRIPDGRYLDVKGIRHQLTWNREALDWWADNYQFEHREMLEEWAKRQVAKL